VGIMIKSPNAAKEAGNRPFGATLPHIPITTRGVARMGIRTDCKKLKMNLFVRRSWTFQKKAVYLRR